jgi:hypothetical protein
MRPWLAIGKWIWGQPPIHGWASGPYARPLDTPTASLCFLCISCSALITTVNRLRADRCTCKSVALAA